MVSSQSNILVCAYFLSAASIIKSTERSITRTDFGAALWQCWANSRMYWIWGRPLLGNDEHGDIVNSIAVKFTEGVQPMMVQCHRPRAMLNLTRSEVKTANNGIKLMLILTPSSHRVVQHSG